LATSTIFAVSTNAKKIIDCPVPKYHVETCARKKLKDLK
jgi:hypothetical protein